MNDSRSPEEERTRLIEFRQTVYAKGFGRRRDALFELLDALLLSDRVGSFAELSRCPAFRREWSSLYAAIEEGGLRSRWIEGLLTRQAPGAAGRDDRVPGAPGRDGGVRVFALDGTAWPRAQSPTLPDRQYVHSPSGDVAGASVKVGVPYSVLCWIAEPETSWVLPLEVRRVPSHRTAIEEGHRQVKRLCRRRKGRSGLDVVVADGGYGNVRFLRPLRNERVGIVARLRKDRVLYGRPGEYRGHGRPAVHGDRFAFKEPDTWPQPAQTTSLEDARWGKVEIQRWNDLHAKEAADTPISVVRIVVHTERVAEREKPPTAIWLAWQAPGQDPADWDGEDPTAEQIWRWYRQRYGIEASLRMRNQELHGRLPHCQTNEAGDRWMGLVSLAQWQLFLARGLVQDRPLPWQKAQAAPSPARVKRGLGALFAQIGSPAQPPQSRGKSPGWPKGKKRTRPPRHPVVKKTPKKPKRGSKRLRPAPASE